MTVGHLLQVIILVVAASPALLAAPVGLPVLRVVADLGGEPAQPYFMAIGAGEQSAEQSVDTPRAAPFSISDMLPVVSTVLSPGKVRRRELDLPVPLPPLFIVGDDPLSVEWLQARYEQLLQLGAVGLVVNVETAHRLDVLRQTVPLLALDPVSGDELAGHLNLTHYPVLITRAGIEQ